MNGSVSYREGLLAAKRRYNRSDKGRAASQRYGKTAKALEKYSRYNRSAKGRARVDAYRARGPLVEAGPYKGQIHPMETNGCRNRWASYMRLVDRRIAAKETALREMVNAFNAELAR